MKKKSKIKYITKYIIFTIITILLFLAIHIHNGSKNVSFEQLLYSLYTSKGTSVNAMIPGILFIVIGTISFIVILILIRYIINKYLKSIEIEIKLNKKKITYTPFKITKNKITILLILYAIFMLIVSMKCYKIDEYVKTQFSLSSIFEKYYINPKETKVTFPEQKRNLIYIYVESLEMTNIDKESGGGFDISYMPNLEEIARNNINFSNSEVLGGAYDAYGTSWTMAAMIAQTSGIPLKMSIDGNELEEYSDSVPGAYSLGDILKKNGYENYLMIGSDANFARRREYFEYHGDYKIFDYYYAKENNWIDEDYYEWWGYEDSKLYEFAKEKLTTISQNSEPFNFTILTADTHFPDGYLDSSCPRKYKSEYANSIYCTDIMLNNFINWIKNQPFYENTTIIITGDHISMQTGFYDDVEDRTIYNAIINSSIETENTKDRKFTTFDMYPTTLASLGINIEGDRLGLGTNLFSNKKTLTEKFGYTKFNEELKKKSFYYSNMILNKEE